LNKSRLSTSRRHRAGKPQPHPAAALPEILLAQAGLFELNKYIRKKFAREGLSDPFFGEKKYFL